MKNIVRRKNNKRKTNNTCINYILIYTNENCVYLIRINDYKT